MATVVDGGKPLTDWKEMDPKLWWNDLRSFPLLQRRASSIQLVHTYTCT